MSAPTRCCRIVLVCFILATSISLSAQSDTAYIASRDGNIYAVDGATNQSSIVASVPQAGFTLDAISPDGSVLYAVGSVTIGTTPVSTIYVIDAVSKSVITNLASSIQGANAVAISPDGTRLYVTMGSGSGQGFVAFVDTSTYQTVGGVQVGPYPFGVVVSPDGSTVYVDDNSVSNLYVVNVSSSQATTYPLANGNLQPSQPYLMALTPDGKHLCVATLSTQYGLLVLETTFFTQVASVPQAVGFGVAISPDGTRAVAPSYQTGLTEVIDTSNWTVISSMQTGAPPSLAAYSPDGTHFYLTNQGTISQPGTGSVNVVDASTYSVITTLTNIGTPLGVIVGNPPGSGSGTGSNFNGVGYVTNNFGQVVLFGSQDHSILTSVSVGQSPQGLAVTPDGASTYVANQGSNNVSVIDNHLALNNPNNLYPVFASIPVGSSPLAVAITPDGSRAYVSNQGDNTVSVIDVPSNTVIATVGVGQNPQYLAVKPDGSQVWVANYSGSVSIIDVASSTMINSVGANFGTTGVTFSADGSRAYVSASNGYVTILDGSTGNYITSDFVGGLPTKIVVAPSGQQLYATNVQQGGLINLNLSTGGTTYIPLNSSISGVAMTPDGKQVFAADHDTGNVSVVSTATNAVLATFPVTSNETDIALGKMPTQAANLASGTNVSASADGVGLTFAQALSGSVTVSSVPPAQLGTPPGGFTLLGSAWDISVNPSSNAQQGIIICFPTPSSLDQATFNTLRVLHYINGVPQDQTILSGPNAPNFSNHTICAQTNSLSPFALARLVPVTTTFVSVPAITYGSNANVTVTVNSASGTPTGSVSLSVDAGTPQTQILSGGSAFFTVNLPSAGGHSVSATYVPQGNFAGSSDTETLTVSPAPLTITANSTSKVLDASNPAFTASYAGFVGSDGPAALSGALSCTSTATTTSPVGGYPINCSGQSSTNYTVSYVAGTLRVLYAAGGTCDGDVGHVILQPVNADGTSVFKQGSTVPAKFRVCDANAVSVGTAGVVSSFRLVQTVSGTVVNQVDEAVYSNTPDTAFRWDSTGQQWIFNMGTGSLNAGVTYYYRISLADGSSITFNFGLR